MIDPDARVWTDDGVEMTAVELGERRNRPNSNNLIADWCDTHIEGEWTVTMTYIFFKLPSDAILFELGYV